MAKKSFKGGLDSLLSGSIPQKEQKENDAKQEQKPLSKEEKHWLQIKNERLLKELHLWRTGQLDVKSFHESLETKGLKYDSEKNIIH
jgi:hypothetical protein